MGRFENRGCKKRRWASGAGGKSLDEPWLNWVKEVLSLRRRCEAISAEGPSSEWWLRRTTSSGKGDILDTREELFSDGAAQSQTP